MPGGVLGVLVCEVSLFCNQHIIWFSKTETFSKWVR